ncbi:hypothetical protein TSTA_048250 [Talaromyces stipitatus ATCC 10500]|uniref:Uncharacterized protein n=1 Tax=Talaromyces stipitatus (strain ATCC 10500 / CBS 375.48 / QM 6759 / NRRL 1006) TaxID=441959 RepID=B8MKM7_TALSN|nr:uncharacterized protein TSTA_048250 [Talaromyces stipitatus ATCC 10500]EED15382.1 hypothetical protein TSTA_048250 [Talaromyces stipitatus ATCC 10500]
MAPQFSTQDEENAMSREPFLKASMQEDSSKNAENLLRPTRQYFLGLLGVTLLIAVTILLSQLFLRNREAAYLLHCGHSVEEARALGCEFDILSYTWTPKECYDKETADEFRQWLTRPERFPRPWPFFADKNRTEWIPSEEALSKRAHMMTYAPQEEHIGHCIFMMRRLHRINDGSAKMNSRFGKYSHTEHCTNETLDAVSSRIIRDEDANLGPKNVLIHISAVGESSFVVKYMCMCVFVCFYLTAVVRDSHVSHRFLLGHRPPRETLWRISVAAVVLQEGPLLSGL